MNRHQAANLLKVSDATLLRWVRQGLLRCADGTGERFEERELARWAAARGLKLGGAETSAQRPAPADDLLASAVRRGAVTASVRVANASEAIRIAVEAVPDLDDSDRERLLDDVLARERMAGTGLGHGFALPHPRKPPKHLIAAPIVSVVFPDESLDWAAMDGEPVHTVFLLLSPSAPVHLQILSRIAFCLRAPELPDFLRTRPSREALVERLVALRPEL